VEGVRSPSVPEAPEAHARELHLEMIEVLKLLNRIEEEQGTIEGLEREEVVHLLEKGGFPNTTLEDANRTLAVLQANGLARLMTDSEYAWDRGRVVGERFAITLEGKRLLLKELERTGRI
jgi:hypothetical protein